MKKIKTAAINIITGFWYVFVLFISMAYSDISYEKMYDYHDVLHTFIGVCGVVFLFSVPVLINKYISKR